MTNVGERIKSTINKNYTNFIINNKMSEKKQKNKKIIEKFTSILFPASPNKKVSIAQLNKVFGKQLFGEQTRPRKRSFTSATPDISATKPKLTGTFSQRVPGTPRKDRINDLNKLSLDTLKDACENRYRVGCQGLKKKDDIISIIIRKEYRLR